MWWFDFIRWDRWPTKPNKKCYLRAIKKFIAIWTAILAIRFFRMPDSRSGVKGRTIRKRLGKFYK